MLKRVIHANNHLDLSFGKILIVFIFNMPNQLCFKFYLIKTEFCTYTWHKCQ